MCSQGALALVRPMTSYRLLDLGYAPALIGWVSALFALAPLVLALPAGRFAHGATRAWGLAVIGSAVVTVACLGLALAQTAVFVAFASALLGAGNLGQQVGYQSLVAAESAEADYDRAFSWYSVGTSIGHLIGPLLGVWTYEHFGRGTHGTTAAMVVGVVAAAIGVAATVFLSPGTRRGIVAALRQARQWRAAPAASGPCAPPISARESLQHPGAKTSVYVSLVIMSCIDLLSVYLPLLGNERGLSPRLIGVLLAIRALCSLLSRVALGTLSARASRRNILIVAAVVSALLVAALAVVGHAGLLIAIMAVLGLAIGIGGPLSLAWTVSIVPPRARSTAIGVRLMGNRLGQVVTPGASAVFVAVGGASSVFVMLGLLLASSAAAVALTSDPG